MHRPRGSLGQSKYRAVQASRTEVRLAQHISDYSFHHRNLETQRCNFVSDQFAFPSASNPGDFAVILSTKVPEQSGKEVQQLLGSSAMGLYSRVGRYIMRHGT